MMNSMYVLLTLFVVYHLFNVYTDCKYRKTKNIWHLAFLTIGFVWFYIWGSGHWFQPIGAMLVAMVFGLLLEFFRQSSAGDTKMMMVTAVLISSIVPSAHFFHISLGIVVLHLVFFSIYTYLFMFRKNGVIKTFKSQWTAIKSILIPGVPMDKTIIFEHFPGAITIMLGSFLYVLLFGYLL